MNTKKPHITKKDLILLACFTVLFGVLLFVRLGNHEAPETHINLDVNASRDIVLEFDEYVDVGKVWMFLGYKGDCEFSFFRYDADLQEWETILEKEAFHSCMTWNSVDVNTNLYCLGMVLQNENCEANELVITDVNGNPLLPANASEYPELFDEQELFSGYPTCYDGSMFDEVYHGRTAYEFVHDLPIYENTHPPLGKSLIGIGIRLFGMNPFGWRFTCALFGMLMVPLFYVFALMMFKRTEYAVYATLLMCTGFMNFTLARISTIDIIVAFFVLCMFFCMYMYLITERSEGWKAEYTWLGLGGISSGLAMATKWTGIYAILGMAILFFAGFIRKIGGLSAVGKERRYVRITALVCVISFVVVPLTIYVLSYIPFVQVYPDKSLLQHCIKNSQDMLSYHKGVTQSHPYSSRWYQWLIDYKPLVDAYDTDARGMIYCVITFMNPFTAIAGLAALIYQCFRFVAKKDRGAGFLLTCFFTMYVPWMFISRTTFIYQYFVPSLFLPLLITRSSLDIKDIKDKRFWMYFLLIPAVLVFGIYYPYLAGTPIGGEYVSKMLLHYGWPY